MEMNNDYSKLCLERIRLINYLNNHLKEDITLSNDDFILLFLIGEDNYENPEMDPVDRVLIETLIAQESIELRKNELKNILDLALEYRIPSYINQLIGYKCLKKYNLTHEEKIGLKNIDIALESIK